VAEQHAAEQAVLGKLELVLVTYEKKVLEVECDEVALDKR